MESMLQMYYAAANERLLHGFLQLVELSWQRLMEQTPRERLVFAPDRAAPTMLNVLLSLSMKLSESPVDSKLNHILLAASRDEEALSMEDRMMVQDRGPLLRRLIRAVAHLVMVPSDDVCSSLCLSFVESVMKLLRCLCGQLLAIAVLDDNREDISGLATDLFFLCFHLFADLTPSVRDLALTLAVQLLQEFYTLKLLSLAKASASVACARLMALIGRNTTETPSSSHFSSSSPPDASTSFSSFSSAASSDSHTRHLSLFRAGLDAGLQYFQRKLKDHHSLSSGSGSSSSDDDEEDDDNDDNDDTAARTTAEEAYDWHQFAVIFSELQEDTKRFTKAMLVQGLDYKTELYVELCDSFAYAPDKRLEWLDYTAELLTRRPSNQRWDEAAQCMLIKAYTISEYLKTQEKHKDLPLNDDFWRKVITNFDRKVKVHTPIRDGNELLIDGVSVFSGAEWVLDTPTSDTGLIATLIGAVVFASGGMLPAAAAAAHQMNLSRSGNLSPRPPSEAGAGVPYTATVSSDNNPNIFEEALMAYILPGIGGPIGSSSPRSSGTKETLKRREEELEIERKKIEKEKEALQRLRNTNPVVDLVIQEQQSNTFKENHDFVLELLQIILILYKYANNYAGIRQCLTQMVAVNETAYQKWKRPVPSSGGRNVALSFRSMPHLSSFWLIGWWNEKLLGPVHGKLYIYRERSNADVKLVKQRAKVNVLHYLQYDKQNLDSSTSIRPEPAENRGSSSFTSCSSSHSLSEDFSSFDFTQLPAELLSVRNVDKHQLQNFFEIVDASELEHLSEDPNLHPCSDDCKDNCIRKRKKVGEEKIFLLVERVFPVVRSKENPWVGKYDIPTMESPLSRSEYLADRNLALFSLSRGDRVFGKQVKSLAKVEHPDWNNARIEAHVRAVMRRQDIIFQLDGSFPGRNNRLPVLLPSRPCPRCKRIYCRCLVEMFSCPNGYWNTPCMCPRQEAMPAPPFGQPVLQYVDAVQRSIENVRVCYHSLSLYLATDPPPLPALYECLRAFVPGVGGALPSTAVLLGEAERHRWNPKQTMVFFNDLWAFLNLSQHALKIIDLHAPSFESCPADFRDTFRNVPVIRSYIESFADTFVRDYWIPGPGLSPSAKGKEWQSTYNQHKNKRDLLARSHSSSGFGRQLLRRHNQL